MIGGIDMYKKFLLKCSTLNHYKGHWQDREFYFDTKEDMIYLFHIVFWIKSELNKIDLDLKF